MRGRSLRAILQLPFNTVVTVPLVILATTRRTRLRWCMAGPKTVRFWAALALFGFGVGLFVATIRLFCSVGGGTLAPWDPTQRLVVVGVYRRVRNPMISAVSCMIAAEALMFGSAGLAIWAGVFGATNAVWIPRFEEPVLRDRFGPAYEAYAQAVPRWIPRLVAWEPGTVTDSL
ncbi:MAG: isoprenylcysteine carboxylmethyltransferase family protein [Acidimicrobiia bacterium]|nr:isoprenylcysteine carboxylmethyltransferase family protein [Acidimicrobiia bacterium]